MKPTIKPNCKNFSSGPCAKVPGYDVKDLSRALLGRSHRSLEGKACLKEIIELTKQVLEIPADYEVAITAGSDTGAFSMALWNMLGARPVTVLAWDMFGKEWLYDVTEELKINAETRIGEPGLLPDLSGIDPGNDIVFTWHGTTSGIWLPDADWISDTRSGLTICDAVSATFITELPWHKLDVTTFAWQKGIGGEAAHGMIVLSPAAILRLKEFTPDRPLPKIFRFKNEGELKMGVFKGETLNTPSLLCVEDYLISLRWIQKIGGIKGAAARANANLAQVKLWLEGKEDWVRLAAEDPKTQSSAAVCLKFCAPEVTSMDRKDQWDFVRRITKRIEDEDAGYDLNGHILDLPYVRIWIGPTVQIEDLTMVLPWIQWAYEEEILKGK